MVVSPPVEKRYAGRGAGIIPVSLSLDSEAVRLLRQFAKGPRRHGEFISRLIFEHAAREELRQAVREGIAPILKALDTEGSTGV